MPDEIRSLVIVTAPLLAEMLTPGTIITTRAGYSYEIVAGVCPESDIVDVCARADDTLALAISGRPAGGEIRLAYRPFTPAEIIGGP